MMAADRFPTVPDVFYDEETRLVASRLVSDLAAHHCVLPGQADAPGRCQCGPHRLRQALLLGAVAEFVTSFAETNNLFVQQERAMQRRAAAAWFSGKPALISFADCCASVGMSPDAMRTKIARLAENYRHRRVGERFLSVRRLEREAACRPAT